MKSDGITKVVPFHSERTKFIPNFMQLTVNIFHYKPKNGNLMVALQEQSGDHRSISWQLIKWLRYFSLVVVWLTDQLCLPNINISATQNIFAFVLFLFNLPFPCEILDIFTSSVCRKSFKWNSPRRWNHLLVELPTTHVQSNAQTWGEGSLLRAHRPKTSVTCVMPFWWSFLLAGR